MVLVLSGCGTLIDMFEVLSVPNAAEAMEIVFVGFILGVVLILVELISRRGVLHPEIARKSIHITAGLIMVVLPIFMDRPQILLTNVIFLLGVLVLTGWLHIFKAVHSVKRWTIGEFLYPPSGVLVVLLFDDLRVYSVSILVLLVSDSLAGLVGRKYGGEGFRVWRGQKSALGSLTFFLSTLIILAGFTVLTLGSPTATIWLMVIFGSVLLTAVEAISGGGIDNLTVPLATAVIASYLLS